MGDTARPLTRAATADLSHCCIPLPVGEETIVLLHVQQSDSLLSHRERDAAAQHLNQHTAGEGSRRITDLRVPALASAGRHFSH